MASYQPSGNNALAISVSLDQAWSFSPRHANVYSTDDNGPLVRPTSPPVPTTVGRTQCHGIPMLEIDEDGIEDIQVPLIPATGRIEGLIRYPSPPSSSPSPPTPIIRPVPDYGETVIPEFDLQDLLVPAPVPRSVIRTNEDVLWRTSNRDSGPGSALLERHMPTIRVVPDEEDSSLSRPQRRQHPRRRPVSELSLCLESFPPFRYSASTIRTRVATEEGTPETSFPTLVRRTSTPPRRGENIGDWIESLNEHIAQVRLWVRSNGLDRSEG